MAADPIKLVELDNAYSRAQVEYEEAQLAAIEADHARNRASEKLHEARTAYLEERYR